jgi:hypothetical protein
MSQDDGKTFAFGEAKASHGFETAATFRFADGAKDVIVQFYLSMT